MKEAREICLKKLLTISYYSSTLEFILEARKAKYSRVSKEIVKLPPAKVFQRKYHPTGTLVSKSYTTIIVKFIKPLSRWLRGEKR